MPVTQIPSRDPLTPPADPPEQRDLFEAQHWETAYRGFNPDDVPHLLFQLQDDLSRERKHEALWLSLVLHLFVVILLWNSEKLMDLFPHRPVNLAVRTNADQSKDATFLELPPDEQKVTRRPDTKVLSDKDRIATSKAPQINREELRKLLHSPHPGQPGANMPQPPAAQPPQSQTAQNAAPPAPQQNSQGFSKPQTSDQTPRLPTPPQNQPVPNFNTSTYAGDAVSQAERAAAANRGYSGSGQAGDGGLTRGRNGAAAGLAPAEILTDTMGVDFGPYITRILQVIKQNWIIGLPPSAYPPIWKAGKDSIDFTILKNGQVTGMVWHSGSGDIALDRAAWGSITGSNPLPALPKEFPGPNLGLRLNFYLNMEISDIK
jgi:outer membrane biosynthesis protein TonB